MAPQHQKTIRVLRIINRFNLGGPTFNVAYLTKYLNEPFETKLVGGEKDDSEASSAFILENLGIAPHTISEMKRSISIRADWYAYKQLVEIIKEYKPHIVHTHASKSGTLGRLAAIHQGVPIILHTFHGHVFHSYFNFWITAVYKFIERWLAARSTKIIAISDIQKQELSEAHKIAPASKIEVIPLGFDLSRFVENQDDKRQAFRQRYGLSAENVAIGIVGRLVPIKNHAMFINAIQGVIAAQSNARFFIIGDGESRAEILSHCALKGIGVSENEKVSEQAPLCFTSWIKEIEVVMAGLDIVALTSLNEGTPVSLIEAQSAEKPVVSTRVGGIEDVVIEGETALLCDVSDEKGFERHLVHLATHPTERTSMGKQGRLNVVKRYSYSRLVEDMRTLYLELLKEKGLV